VLHEEKPRHHAQQCQRPSPKIHSFHHSPSA
jgi:hypothetical protein